MSAWELRVFGGKFSGEEGPCEHRCAFGDILRFNQPVARGCREGSRIS